MPQCFTNLSLPPSMYDGRLGGIVSAYADLLYQQGYTHQSARLQLRFLADLSCWLDRRRYRNADITEAQIYLEANLALKEKALAKTKPLHVKTGRYRPSDSLLRFLNTL